MDWQAAGDVPEMAAGRLDLPVWPLEHVETLPADPDVLAEAANCLLARAMAEAGSRYDRGDTAGASGAVAEARAVYQRIACYSSAPIGGGVVEKLAGMGQSMGRRDLCREDVKAMAAEGFQLTRGSGGNPKSSRRRA